MSVSMLGGALLRAQEAAAPQPRVFVDFVSASNIVVSPGHSTPVQFNFHVHDPYHINSSHPLTEELIPTQLHFSLPDEVAYWQIAVSGRKADEFPF